jgi:hypothetical protein
MPGFYPKMQSDLDLLNSAEESLKWFHDNFNEIREKFAGKQIAIRDKEIIAFADNGKKLLELLKTKNIDDSEVIIERITPKGEIIIL